MTAQFHADLHALIARSAGPISANDDVPALVTKALGAGEGRLTAEGAFATTTGAFTGRSPKDKFVVRDAETDGKIWWENSGAMTPEAFETLLSDMLEAASGKPLYQQDLRAGAAQPHQVAVRVYTETAWHALFIRNLLIRPTPDMPAPGADPVTILHLPGFMADPARHGTRTSTVIALDMARRLVLIAGTFYAGEIKKSVFSLFNYHAPSEGVMPMHCSANVGREGDVALFFGLSGTGKTTLSNDPERPLIGDDEHGWSDEGVFNLEGGCYAKTVKLSRSAEPEIYAATRSFGTVLENLVLGEDSRPLYDDVSLTENTRAAYPIETLPAIAPGGTGGQPRTVVFLTADAFGVLPPIARLTPEQAVYHFLSGYTAKVAGTERGVTEPQATFSACFGAPFMPLHPSVYGKMLAERLRLSGARTFLLNTGWTGGGYGTGRRIDIASTRRLLAAALSGELDHAEMREDPLFGLAVPVALEGIDPALLEPRRTWADADAYDAAAGKLQRLFVENFRKFGPEAAKAAEAGPRLAAAAE
ncbi:phosphoenolpyruvate carboxykinase (ATP) [Arsenicitalea aurantiaca]|uniref:Phosphoenolpyruvate carboxykinase (ATP) n=1 Tax=Arsenicitalea aurantiaca TaxID=1783274 RepID=A0A433X892_9HYPH|nr:phosphoenolpyruvate carboxykinase (ATP) [Arsenicitalea aurantiaca]RUT30285.1 phosphoenolpyruvate carboxykinase (ATP) [Arsenicitalea aurantiaca]